MTMKRIFLLLFVVISLIGCWRNSSTLEKAHTLFDKGSYESSISLYSDEIKNDPNDADNYYYRGLALLMSEKFELANTDFSQAIALDDKYVYAYINRGSLWVKKGEIEKALNDFNRVLQLEPNNLRAIEIRADLFFKLNKFEESIRDYDSLIDNGRNVSENYQKRGDVKYFKLDYGGAIRDYSTSIKNNQNNHYAYNNLAWIQATCVDEEFRNGTSALSNAKKAIELDNNKHYLSTLAAAYAEEGEFNNSVKILNEIIQKNDLSRAEVIEFQGHLTQFMQSKPLRVLPGE